MRKFRKKKKEKKLYLMKSVMNKRKKSDVPNSQEFYNPSTHKVAW